MKLDDEYPTPSNVWRLRTDAWEYLGYAAKQLHGITDPTQAENGLISEVRRQLRVLEAVETYWAVPGSAYVAALRARIEENDHAAALALVEAVTRGFARFDPEPEDHAADQDSPARVLEPARPGAPDPRPRFEVLVIDDMSETLREDVVAEMLRQRRNTDAFAYDVNVVPSLEDALIAVLLNPTIQACILRPGFSVPTRHRPSDDLRKYLDALIDPGVAVFPPRERILRLADLLKELRPELDLYLVADVSIEELAGSSSRRFNRLFRRAESMELHLSLLRGVAERFKTPFFDAVQHHSRKPAAVFHALPISRGGSVVNSRWIKDMGEFYGLNLLHAETSATSGGLDSLLDPRSSIKGAQELAARAFGARRTYFVTNGTSTANKIVHQSIVAPGDVVIADRNCHKSHHYALMLAGAQVAYVDAYPLDEYSFYGAVPLKTLKGMLLDYRRAGRLDEVKMVTLTNCTFDGIVYDVQRVMEECLAIKPDLVFLWDEAWFAFAGFHPIYRRRTAMAAAGALEANFKDPEYIARAKAQREALFDPETGQPVDDQAWLSTRLLPDPETARLRVYATQSTHKTLTSLRQGSMIHVFDQDFSHLNEVTFREAYMTHTSTSPNYQILASLDIGRRQAELEGYELVQRQAYLAQSVARMVARHPLLKKYFRVLNTHDLIPEEFRTTRRPMPLQDGIAAMDEAWRTDEFVVDPSRLTLHIGRTGVDGDTFKHKYLMDLHGIQVNKTSRNTVLFMTNIGTSRSSVAYLIDVLVKLAERFERERADLSPLALEARTEKIAALIGTPPPLPDFSRFADRFRSDGQTIDGDIRAAYFTTYKTGSCGYLMPHQLADRVLAGDEVVSAGFVTPYPPGFPILVPGQVVTKEILSYMEALDTREIHGFDPNLGYRIINELPVRTAGA
ncbi:aminotransferase class I/II-fold pyridoxal phosphate-dependent enzyme [Paeniglutamicibacter kerguelensis]|uniref:Arginine decarboxylase n=1 Tax=Paeniglutamicibacter kerguelensis TaxID=254788 RepID=A0ABS4X984_9MICC|nr:arginine decarboxylase [Paeniglutamicibacter kerguelensis]